MMNDGNSAVTRGLVMVLVLMATALGQQESKPAGETKAVPLLSDIPTIGQLFQRQDKNLWWPLDDRIRDFAPEGEKPQEGPSFYERWLLHEIKERHPKVEDVQLVEHVTLRWHGQEKQRSMRRGLEISGPSATLAAVRRWLEAQRGQRKYQVVVEFRIVSGAQEMPERKGEPVPQVVVVDEAEYSRRLNEIRQQKVEILNAPSLTLLNGQRGNLSVVNQISYVRDFELQVVRGTVLTDPVIDVVNEGIVVDVAPVLHPDGKQLSLDTRISISSVKRPIEQITTRLEGGGGGKVTVEVPQVSVSEWKSGELVLPTEAWFLVTGLATMKGDWKKGPVGVDVLAHVRVLDPEAGGSAPVGKVIGVDRKASRVFVRWPGGFGDQGVPAARPSIFTVWRDGKQVGRIQVVEWVGSNIGVLRPLDEAKVQMRDQVK